MENKPNNEISELLARLQQKVEKKSAPGVDSVKPSGETPEELLDLLKKNIGAPKKEAESCEPSEYNIEGYEFAVETGEDTAGTPVVAEDETVIFLDVEEALAVDEPEAEVEDPELEEKLRERVESLVSDSVSADEIWNLPKKVEKLHSEVDTDNSEMLSDADNEPVVQDPVDKLSEAIEPEENLAADECEPLLLEDIGLLDKESLADNADILLDNAVSCEANVPKDESVSFSQEKTKAEDMLILLDAREEKICYEPLDEYKDLYLEDDEANRFFGLGKTKTENKLREEEPIDAPDFDDIDINLALALGSKEALESSVGYARVRSARNGFYDPFFEEFTGERTYGYDGEEFRNAKQIDSIKKRYASENRRIRDRLIATFFLSILILFLENLPMTAIRLPYLSNWLNQPSVYYFTALLLSALLIAISRKRIGIGLRSCMVLQGDPFGPIACLSVLNFTYNLIVLLFFRESGMSVYNFAMAIFLLFGIADDGMRLTRERLAFDVVSDRKPKLSLERLEEKAQNESNVFSFGQEFFVEKVTFVGNFFTRSGRRSLQLSEYFHELAFSTLGALVVSLFSLFLTDDISTFFASFAFSMFICVPMQFLIANIYPFFHLTKGLSKLDSAVIGDAVSEEYNDTDTIYLEDSEMFGKHGARVVGVRSYNDMDFYSLLSYALSVFTVIGAPLCNVFDNSAKEIEKKENVRITDISVGGVKATVEDQTVYIGNLAFMRSHGYFPKRNTDDEKKIESGQICILYLAIGGELCAKLYVQYTVTQRFEKFAAEMLRNGVRVGIRTLDPNVNEKMIAALRNDKNVSIKVIRPTPNELIPIGKHSDSGIVTSKNSHMIFKILEQCFNIKRIYSKQRCFRLLSLLLGVILSAFVMVGKLYAYVPSLYIVIYQVLWLVPSLIYTKSKLK
ncbi:MAG: hypothetical protein E7606_00485 [Ruminococcaceae bacterium]|nr:hypothetical protein [Oscillospiraceae bacterium]